MFDRNDNSIVLPVQGAPSGLKPIKVTVRDVRRIDTKGGNPIANPFYSVDCSGLPTDNAGNEITNFAIFNDSEFFPEDFEVGKTYEITGVVAGRYFNLKSNKGLVENPVPGVAGVPKDLSSEKALNTAMMVAGEVMKGLSFENESEAFIAFEFLYRQMVALRFQEAVEI